MPHIIHSDAEQSLNSRYFTPGRSLICDICSRAGHLARSCYYHKVNHHCHKTQSCQISWALDLFGHAYFVLRRWWFLLHQRQTNQCIADSLKMPPSTEVSHLHPVWDPGPHPEGLSQPLLPQLWPPVTQAQALREAPAVEPTLQALWRDWAPSRRELLLICLQSIACWDSLPSGS